MKEAIQKAIKGGWKPFGSILHKNLVEQKWGVPEVMANFYHQPTFLLDPLFWQALSKSLGYAQGPQCSNRNCPLPEHQADEWKDLWHRFIDHLAEGKDAEEFFKQLLK